MTEVWALVDEERHDFADFCDGLTTAQWDRETLCEAWRVRDVVAHVYQGATMTNRSLFVGMLRYGFRVNTMIERGAIEGGRSAPAKLAADIRATIGLRGTPGGTAARALSGEMIHQQDIRRALDVPRSIPDNRLRVALEEMKASKIGLLPGKKRAAGLHLHASDIDWETGNASAPEVNGAGEALVMAMAGRQAALADLSGSGVELLRARG